MDYEKEYKKLKADIEKAYLFAQTDSTKAVLEHILSELRESEDEKIRETLIGYFKNYKTQEDKNLLLKDVCARLPYGVVVETQLVNAPRAKYPVLKVLQSYMLCDFMQTIGNVIHKPYLRSMSSMTEEEKEQIRDFWIDADVKTHATQLIDFYNKYHFDYRGLIEKGLAIEVTKENNPYNE